MWTSCLPSAVRPRITKVTQKAAPLPGHLDSTFHRTQRINVTTLEMVERIMVQAQVTSTTTPPQEIINFPGSDHSEFTPCEPRNDNNESQDKRKQTRKSRRRTLPEHCDSTFLSYI